MSWQLEIPIKQVVVVAAMNVNREVSFTETYSVDIVNETISPDPTVESSLDNDFTALVALKAACILDQSTYRTKAINEVVFMLLLLVVAV